MKEKSKKSLILQIANAYGHTHDVDPGRYEPSTNSLYSEPKITPAAAPDVRETDTVYVTMEENVFQDVLNGSRSFAVVKSSGCFVGKTLYIRETKNFVTTGRILIKKIAYVLSGCEAEYIKDGYCIVSWRE